MNNMRRGFTLIELIFVIVIIGILAAVALPRFIETADAAHVGKMKAYAGTLSRTTIPPIWNKSMEQDNNGSIITYDTLIQSSLKYPVEITTFNGFGTGNLEVVIDTDTPTAPSNAVGTAIIGGVTYTVACTDGNMTNSPKCNLWDGTALVWMVKY